MFNRREGTWSDRNLWTDEQDRFPSIGTSHHFSKLMEARKAKGILIEARSEGGDFPSLERGYGNLLDKRQRTFGERLLAELSQEIRTPRDEKTGQPITREFSVRDPETEGREL